MAGRAGSGNGYMDENGGDGPLFLNREQIDERKRLSDELTTVDEILIRNAGVKTPAEISEITGVPAEDIARRIHEILNSVDILTIEQKRAKMVLMLEAMIAEAQSRMATATDRVIGAILNSTGGNVTRVLNELSEMENRTKMDIEAINQRRAHELLHMIERAVDRSIGELASRNPEFNRDEVEEVFRGHLVALAAEYDAS